MLNNIKVIKSALKTDEIKKKIVSGTIWLSFGGGVEQGLRLVRNMFLTRLLLPESMGTMAIILSVNAAFESFSQIGIKEAIIQNDRGFEKDVLNGAWLLLFIRAIFLCVVGVLLAPLIASFYKIENITFLLRISFLAIFLNGITSSAAYAALKKMEYKKWVIYYYGGGFTGVATTIVMALFYPNIHSLVIGYIAEAFFRTVYSYILFPFKPSIHVNDESLKPLLIYAKRIFGLPLLFFIFSRTDIFVLGKMCSKDIVGYYMMAASIAQIPETFFVMIMEPLMLPLLSRYKGQIDKFSKIILRSVSLIIYTSIPFLSVCYIYRKDILTILFGESYAVMGGTFIVLILVSILKVLNIPFTSAYFAMGRPDFYRFTTILRTVLLLMIIVPLIKIAGVIGVAIAVFCAILVAFIFQLIHINKIINLNYFENLSNILLSLLISLPVLIFSMIPINNKVTASFVMITSVLLTCTFQIRLCMKTFFKLKNNKI